MAIVTISTKGQIVIPKGVREILGLRPGTKINIEFEGDEIKLRPIKENIPDRLYGKYRGINLLADLEKEHRREVEKELSRGTQR